MNDGIQSAADGTGVAMAANGDGPQADPRIERIADYVTEALRQEDPLAANLGAVNANLMALEHRWRQALDEVIGEAPASLEVMEVAMPAVESYLKVVKQIDRFSRLTIKLAEASRDESVDGRDHQNPTSE